MLGKSEISVLEMLVMEPRLPGIKFVDPKRKEGWDLRIST